MLQVLAPLIEGSIETEEVLLQKITDKFESLGLPDTVRQYIKEPDEFLNGCFSRTQNLSGKVMQALEHQIKDIDVSVFPKHTWKVNLVEMLEPQYKSADIKKIRQKRRSFFMKVELLVSIISSIEYDPVDPALTLEDLEAKVKKLDKIENEEYLASLRSLTHNRKP